MVLQLLLWGHLWPRGDTVFRLPENAIVCSAIIPLVDSWLCNGCPISYFVDIVWGLSLIGHDHVVLEAGVGVD